MRRRSLAVTLAVVCSLALVAPQPASSAPPGGPRAERDRVRAEQARVAAQIDTTKASITEIDRAVQALQENVASEERKLAETEAQVAQATEDIADAKAAISKRQDEIGALEVVMRERAVRAYVSPPGDDVLTVLETKDFTSAAERRFYVDLKAQDDADISDRLDGAVTDLSYQKRKAAAARTRADVKRAEQRKRTTAVREAEAAQQALAAKMQSTVNSQIERSVQLAKTDRALSSQIAKQQAALVARIAAQKAAKDEADKRAAAAAANRPAPVDDSPAPPSNQSPGGGETAPLPPVGSGGGGTGTGGISLCTVGGITVNCAIRGQVESMLNAARASGLVLSGGGYRDASGQIAARKRNCGTSYYAIYEMPASSCRPPTARPGTSQHEVGLAIDFSNCGRSSSCFSWLRGNASRFGFYNLPSESWHWSTSGN